MRDEFKDDFQGGERFGTPIDRNEGKQSMLNLVPFAGRRRIMRHRDREVFLIGKSCSFFFHNRFLTPLEPRHRQ